MKSVYVYRVINRKNSDIMGTAYVRDDARYLKQQCKDVGIDAEIIQRKYVLAEERVVR